MWCARTNAHRSTYGTVAALIMHLNAVLHAENARYLGLVAANKIELEATMENTGKVVALVALRRKGKQAPNS